jgi:hypothetical protein
LVFKHLQRNFQIQKRGQFSPFSRSFLAFHTTKPGIQVRLKMLEHQG